MHMCCLYLVCLVSDSNQGESGKNCSTPCPENCVDGLCEVVNETCFECLEGNNGSNIYEGYCRV